MDKTKKYVPDLPPIDNSDSNRKLILTEKNQKEKLMDFLSAECKVRIFGFLMDLKFLSLNC